MKVTRVVLRDRQLNRLLHGPDGAIAQYLLQAVQRVERRAKQLAPVDTGRLRSSITSGLAEDGSTVAGLVGTDVDYAVHVEYGTYRMAPQPFMRPALEEVVRT